METFRQRLEALGFSNMEINAVELVLARMGILSLCEHTKPRFIECYELDDDSAINEARWQKHMREMGFRADSILVAEHAIFDGQKGST